MEYTSSEFALANGKVCVIRRAEAEDAEALLHYQKQTSGETPYLVTGPEDIDWTVEQQVRRIEMWNAGSGRLRLVAMELRGMVWIGLVNSGCSRKEGRPSAEHTKWIHISW